MAHPVFILYYSVTNKSMIFEFTMHMDARIFFKSSGTYVDNESM